MHPEEDAKGRLVCRFCCFSWYDAEHHRFNCRIGDDPGPVDADRASCDHGQICQTDHMAERDAAEVNPKWNL